MVASKSSDLYLGEEAKFRVVIKVESRIKSIKSYQRFLKAKMESSNKLKAKAKLMKARAKFATALVRYNRRKLKL